MKVTVVGDYYVDPKPGPVDIEVDSGTPLRTILRSAKERGLRFGYGVLTVDGVPKKINDIGTPVYCLPGKNEVEITFSEEVPPQAIDLDSVL